MMLSTLIAANLAAAAAQETGGDPLPFLIIGLWILMLAIFVGFEMITKVPPTIHTPLMSGANAISGITIAGALVCTSSGYGTLGQVLGFLAITFATINCVGGFLVTDRMLKMFGQKGGKR